MSKTPEYTRRAIARYEAKTVRKAIIFNPENALDKKILERLDSDKKPFSQIVKECLSIHYNIDETEG